MFAVVLLSAVGAARAACKDTLSQHLDFTPLRWEVAKQTVECGETSACAAILPQNARLRVGKAELTVGQRPCFDDAGNNAETCCSGLCASWAGASIASKECVDTGVLHFDYALSAGVDVRAPLTSWRLPTGHGHVSVVRAQGWTAALVGGKTVHNETNDGGSAPIVLRAVSLTGSAPAYTISTMPPGVGASKNSAPQRFVVGAGGVWGPDGELLHVNNASRIHLPTSTVTNGACSPCARALSPIPTVRVATADEMASSPLVFNQAGEFSISSIDFEPFTQKALATVLSETSGISEPPAPEPAVQFIPHMSMPHTFEAPEAPPAQPRAPHAATLALDSSMSWTVADLTHQISSVALATSKVRLYACTVAIFDSGIGDSLAVEVASVARVSDIGIDCNAARCAYIITRRVRRIARARTISQATCASITIAAEASDERVSVALASVRGQIAVATTLVTVAPEESADGNAWWLWIIGIVSILIVVCILVWGCADSSPPPRKQVAVPVAPVVAPTPRPKNNRVQGRMRTIVVYDLGE